MRDRAKRNDWSVTTVDVMVGWVISVVVVSVVNVQ